MLQYIIPIVEHEIHRKCWPEKQNNQSARDDGFLRNNKPLRPPIYIPAEENDNRIHFTISPGPKIHINKNPPALTMTSGEMIDEEEYL